VPRGGLRQGGGGRQPGSGRKPGSPNKVTKDVRALAQQYGPDAILGLAILAGLAPPLKRLPTIKAALTEPVQRGAMDSLLDRAYGKPSQPMEHSLDESFESILDRLGR
jgi:hypothetical protein